ncbi:hypothetical protein PHEL85_3250 [Polaribacter sp. Hel1_85]|nr:hypothetical protein PHEL85_3250 [Polaribacter sp. Hel1_85]
MLINIIYLLSFLSTLIFAIFYFRKSFDINLRYFSAYLFFMFLFEIIASFVKYQGYDNLWIYNMLTLIEFNCLFFFLRSIILSIKVKKIVLYIVYIFNAIYILTNIYYLFLENYLVTYNSIVSISGSFLISIVIFLFFRDFLNSDKILNYWKTLSFWISFGLLFYYLGTIPFTSIINFMSDIPQSSKIYLIKVQFFLTIFMYSCFIFGALWSQKQVK